MQRLEVSGAVRPIYGSLGVKSLTVQILLVTWYTSRFNFQQLYALPTLYLCIFYLSQIKQRHLLHTT